MSNKRAHVDINGTTLFMDMIYSIIPIKRTVLIKFHEYYLHLASNKDNAKYGLIAFKIDDDVLFNRIKFEYIKYIKKLPNPEDRVADFEWRDENDLPDFDKMDRLIEKRKTRDEKAKEFQEELYIKQQCEKFKIEYFGPLREQ